MHKRHKTLIAATCLTTFIAFIFMYANNPELSDATAHKIVVGIVSLAMVVYFSVSFRAKLAMPALSAILSAVAVFNVAFWSWALDKIPFNPLPLWIVFFSAQFYLLDLFLDRLAPER